MELGELFGKLSEAKSSEETYVLLSLMGDAIEAQKDELKEKFSDEQPRSMAFPELGKTFNIMEIKKNTLPAEEVKARMTDTEIRTVYKPTLKDLDALKRSDLKELSTVTIQKQVRILSLAQ